MLSRIIRKEILEHLMSLRFAIACVLCFVVILSSVFVRFQDYSNALEDYHEDFNSDTNTLNNISDPSQLAGGGVRVRQKPNPLKVFVRGMEDTNGAAVQVNAYNPVQIESSKKLNPMVPLFPAMDFQYFVGVIMSLLAIVFAYDAVCGEKEHGTLRLMLSYSVPRDKVLLGKWIGGYAALIIPFLLAVISAAAVVLVQSSERLSGDQWLKLASICGLALVYVAAMYSIALWVSTLTARASTSVMVLITIWMILVLAIPNLSPYLAQAWRPIRSPVDIESARSQTTEEVNQRLVRDRMDAYDQQNGFTRNWRRGLNTQDPTLLDRVKARDAYRRQCQYEASVEILRGDEKILQDIEGQLESQVALSRWIARLSPFSCFALASTELTDTGLLSKRHFTQQLRKYQMILSKYAFDQWGLFGSNYTWLGEKPRDWRKEREERGQPIPVFVHSSPASGEYLKAVVADGGMLLGAALLFFLLSYLTFLRYDVR